MMSERLGFSIAELPDNPEQDSGESILRVGSNACRPYRIVY